MNIRKAVVEDTDKLIGLRFSYLSDDKGRNFTQSESDAIVRQLRDYIPRQIGNEFYAYIAELGDQAIASVFLVVSERPANPSFITGKIGTILNVFTNPLYRHKGIATQLLKMAINEAKAMNISRLELSASRAGKPLYEMLGFQTNESGRHTEMSLQLFQFDSPRACWYHGSSLELAELAAGSTVTQWKELAIAFSHKPVMLEYNHVGGLIKHDGTKNGFLYSVDEPILEDTDIYSHPNTSMDEGVEWVTKRTLRLKKIGTAFAGQDILYHKAVESETEQIIITDHLHRSEGIRKAVHQGECYIAEDNSKILGFAIMNYSFFGFGFIELLIIGEEYRRRGIGATFLNYLFLQCTSEKLFTSTNESNAPMRNLVAKGGFKSCGRIDALDEGDPELFFVRSAIEKNSGDTPF